MRDWVKPGTKVAIWVSSGWDGRGTVTGYDEIDRVLKRDIVLKSGRRFYFRTDYAQNPIEKGQSNSYRTDYLLELDDIKVRNYQTDMQDSKWRNEVDCAFNTWRQHHTVAAGTKLVRAVEAWVALQPQEVSS